MTPAEWNQPLSKNENRAFVRLSRLFRNGRLPEKDNSTFFMLRERVRNTMPRGAERRESGTSSADGALTTTGER